jgi:hypothetical protein
VSSEEQIGKLQGLLERIQRHAAEPRAPIAFSAPVYSAPPVVAAPPAPPPPAPPPPSYDQSVDELLGIAPERSPMPIEVDVALDTLPPVAEAPVTLPSAPPDAEPIPLVSLAAEQGLAPPPFLDDTLDLDSEVSEVRITTGTREPEAEVTVAAIEAEAEQTGPEELSEEDLVEIADLTAAPPATSDVDIDFEDQDEQPPASSQRSRVASSMDEALAAAAAQHDAEREAPLKTPPPESGPQAASLPLPSGLSAPGAPDVDALLGQELDIPTHADTIGNAGYAPPLLVPTTEQLGQTIELEEARGPSLELAEHQLATAEPAPIEELEVALPSRESVGGYDNDLQPPPEAREELEAHRRRLEDDIPPPPESLAQLPSIQPGPEIVPIVAAPVEGPELLARPLPYGGVAESFSSVRESFRPSSFIDLLDASLSLDGE